MRQTLGLQLEKAREDAAEYKAAQEVSKVRGRGKETERERERERDRDRDRRRIVLGIGRG
jgi:hypothetical protein